MVQPPLSLTPAGPANYAGPFPPSTSAAASAPLVMLVLLLFVLPLLVLSYGPFSHCFLLFRYLGHGLLQSALCLPPVATNPPPILSTCCYSRCCCSACHFRSWHPTPGYLPSAVPACWHSLALSPHCTTFPLLLPPLLLPPLLLHVSLVHLPPIPPPPFPPAALVRRYTALALFLSFPVLLLPHAALAANALSQLCQALHELYQRDSASGSFAIL